MVTPDYSQSLDFQELRKKAQPFNDALAAYNEEFAKAIEQLAPGVVEELKRSHDGLLGRENAIEEMKTATEEIRALLQKQ